MACSSCNNAVYSPTTACSSCGGDCGQPKVVVTERGLPGISTIIQQETFTGVSNAITLGDDYAYTHFGDTTSNDVTFVLPDATDPLTPAGRIFVFKKIAGANNLIVTGSQTIDGAVSKTISTLYESIVIQSDGTPWFIIG